MLLNHFFEIEKIEKNSDKTVYTIALISTHAIYDGHFPGQPVVPGVVSMQIIKELLEDDLSCKLQVQKVANAKFLSPLIPKKDKVLFVEITKRSEDADIVKIMAQISTKNHIALKLQAAYTKVDA